MSRNCLLNLACPLLLVIAGCQTLRPAPSLTILTDSLDPLRTQFNEHPDRLRIVALLSPT